MNKKQLCTSPFEPFFIHMYPQDPQKHKKTLKNLVSDQVFHGFLMFFSILGVFGGVYIL